MNRTIVCLATVTALVLGGCSDDQASENAAANQLDEASNEMAMVNDPSNPFAEAETQMQQRMIAATGANASETWVRKMIEHHRGAVAMSQLLIDAGGNPDYVQMARADGAKQQREISELERMLAAGITGGSGEANPYGPAEQNMHQQMMAATGADLSETWARKMIAHHQGAVAMSEVLIRQGGNPQVVALARRTAEDQRRDIAHLEAMLRGESMPVAAAPAVPAAPAARSAPDAAAKESPRVTPTRAAREPSAAPKATPSPRPEPSPPATATCLPEHRAAGHC